MAELRRIPRKPLPPGSRYAALLATSTSHDEEINHSLSPIEPASLTEDFQRFVSARLGPSNSQRSLHAPKATDDEGVPIHSAMKSTILFETSEQLHEHSHATSNALRTRRNRSNGSIWLSTPFLAVFALLLVAMLIALILLYHFANQELGFGVDLNSSVNPYTWRYGPVAVLTIVAALWHQTDYHCKVAAPWLHIQYRVTPGQKSMLLDYVSPWLPVGLYIAIQNRDWRVFVSGCAYGLLKLVILVSTGLFAVQETVTTLENQSLSLVWSLNQIAFNGTYFPGPVDAYWGIVDAGLQYARGTNAFAAFQTFSTKEKFSPNATISAEVAALFPTMECEAAQSESVAVNVFRSWTNNCSIGNYSTVFCVKDQSDCTSIASRALADASEVTLSALMWPFVCGGIAGYVEEDSVDIHYLLALLEAQNVNETGPESTQVITSLFCHPKYSMEKARLDFDTSEPVTSRSFQLSNPLTASGDMIEGISPSELAYMVSTLVNSAAAIVPDPSRKMVQHTDSFFSLMLATENQSDLAFFTSPEQMAKTGQAVFQGLAVQMANQWLTPSLSSTTTGTITSPQQRLFVQLSSLWAMCVLLALVVISTLCIGLLDREGLVHQAFGNHSWNLYMLCRSEEVRKYLRGLGAASDRSLQEHVSTVRFKSKVDDNCISGIEIYHAGENVKITTPKSTPETWRPLGVRRKSIISTVTLLIALITALEVIQRKSGDDGFASVTTSPSTAHVLSTYIPAAILLSTAAVLGCLEFAVKVMAPFQSRKATGTQAESSILFSAFHLTPVVLYDSIRRRKYAVFLVTWCGLLASILTIISAGLYRIDYLQSTFETTFEISGSFNLSQDAVGSLEGGLTAGLLEYYNATYPNGTFSDLVYPRISFDSSESQTQRLLKQNHSSIVVRSNVLRPSLNCSAIPSGQLTVTKDNTSETVDVVTIGDVPERCRKERLGGVTQFRTGGGASASAFRGWSEATSYAGTFIWIDPYNGDDNEWGSYNSHYADGCQSMGFMWGSWSNTSLDASNFIMYTCTQLVEVIPATLTFSTPDMALDLSAPPTLDESKAQVVSDYQFPTGYLGTYGFDAPFDCDLDSVDPFFTAVVCGSMSNITKADLGDPSKSGQVLNAATHVYGLLVAQDMNTHMRTDGDPSNVVLLNQVTATIRSANRLRIFQNDTSKIILQAVLAASLVCFVLSYALTDTKLLPHDPMSLAGSMSLLTGSKLCETMQDKGESFEEFEDRIRGTRFRHGWWSREGLTWFGLNAVQEEDI